MNHNQLLNKKHIWIASGILLAIIVCSLLVWLGGGMVGMIRTHLGM
jgi:hypothetical protein